MTKEAFAARLRQECGVVPGSHVLMAVSGGADSTALFCFFLEIQETYPLTLSCAHMEHGIRGEASVADMEFVRGLCKAHQIPFYARQADVPAWAKAHGMGLEEAARTLRYRFLRETAAACGADVIALAHHRTDQAETLLLHASRGCDIRGLCGMRARRDDLIRPLLSQTPEALRQALAQRGMTWREDESNASAAYTRNRIRLNVLPELEKACPGAEAAFCRLTAAAQRDEDFFTEQLRLLGLLPAVKLVNGAALPRERLSGLHDALAGRALVCALETAEIEPQSARTLTNMLEAIRSGRRTAVNLTGDARAEMGRNWVCLLRPGWQPQPVPLHMDGTTPTPFGTFSVRDAREGERGDGIHNQTIPAALLEGAVVTGPHPGDCMVPFGAHSPVRFKKLMEDAGIEHGLRAGIPVLRRGEEVLWLPGIRPSEALRAVKHEKRKWVAFDGMLTDSLRGIRTHERNQNDHQGEKFYHGK